MTRDQNILWLKQAFIPKHSSNLPTNIEKDILYQCSLKAPTNLIYADNPSFEDNLVEVSKSLDEKYEQHSSSIKDQ